MACTKEQFEMAKGEAEALIDSHNIQIAENARPFLSEAYAKMKAGGMLPKDALKLPAELMELAYQYGYNLFQSGKYREALPIFSLLRQLDISDLRTTFAIAACHHYSGEYLEAAGNYLVYKYMDPLNPIPNYHLYDCYMKAEYLQTALYVLQEGIILCDRDPRHGELGERLRLEMEHLKEILKSKYEWE